MRLVPVAYRRQRRRVFPVDLDVQPNQVLVAPLQDLVLHGGVPLATGLDLIEEIGDHLRNRDRDWRWRCQQKQKILKPKARLLEETQPANRGRFQQASQIDSWTLR